MNQSTFKPKSYVYLIGGWASDESAWLPVAVRLARKPLLELTIVDWRRALCDPDEVDRRLLEHRGCDTVGPVILVGWSLGGMLALQAALRCQDRIAGLVLIGTTARMCEAPDYPGVDSRVIRGMKIRLRADREGTLADFARLCFTDLTTDHVLDSTICETYARQSESCENSLLTAGLNYLQKTDLRDSLDAIQCPCKILHARNDAVIPFAEAKCLADRLPNAEFELLDTGTHALPIVESDKTADVILSMCQEALLTTQKTCSIASRRSFRDAR